MPRACVIVLDAVGAGDLPDADAFGTSGSNTLAHVAEAVGGLELPNLQSLGLGNVAAARGLPAAAGSSVRVGPPGRAQRRHGHHDRALGDDGHRPRAPVSDVPGRLPRTM